MQAMGAQLSVRSDSRPAVSHRPGFGGSPYYWQTHRCARRRPETGGLS